MVREGEAHDALGHLRSRRAFPARTSTDAALSSTGADLALGLIRGATTCCGRCGLSATRRKRSTDVPQFDLNCLGVARIRGVGLLRLAGEERMNATLTLVDLAGMIVLLLWGVHMVQTSIHPPLSPDLSPTLGQRGGR